MNSNKIFDKFDEFYNNTNIINTKIKNEKNIKKISLTAFC